MGDGDQVEPTKLKQGSRFIVMKGDDGNVSTCMPEHLVCTVESVGKAPLGPSQSPTTHGIEPGSRKHEEVWLCRVCKTKISKIESCFGAINGLVCGTKWLHADGSACSGTDLHQAFSRGHRVQR
jgi:hypothetical protein